MLRRPAAVEVGRAVRSLREQLAPSPAPPSSQPRAEEKFERCGGEAGRRLLKQRAENEAAARLGFLFASGEDSTFTICCLAAVNSLVTAR